MESKRKTTVEPHKVLGPVAGCTAVLHVARPVTGVVIVALVGDGSKISIPLLLVGGVGGTH